MSAPTLKVTKSPNVYPQAPRPAAFSDLKLKGILWSQGRPLALINDKTVAVQEEFRIRIGQTNEVLRCLSIGKDNVKVRVLSSGKEQELVLAQP
jgi:hypothetical protein